MNAETAEIVTKADSALFAEKENSERVDSPDKIDESTQAVPSLESSFSFPLRGNNLNPVVDASASLLALMNRLSTLKELSDTTRLHKQICNDLDSIEMELHRAGYDRVSILAHRYCLCSAIDETVMCSAWGQDSDWPEKSLLATFHSETWGGEKLFIILERLMMEAERYIELIEFVYLLLCLGFEGRYRVMHNGRQKLEEVIREVHEVIRKERGDPPEQLLESGKNLMPRRHFVSRQTPESLVWMLAVLFCGVIFFGFYISITQHTDRIIEQLQQLL